ncbi:hypothetical protein IAQ61_005790 [Plenodomus lingam]|uniref:uncharacterized protein n=1 Tax=Leptosphaeria maculans TaxID=5022 RepID=UPI0033319B71|nr:hypothetical protein IAQ61_005790 [Plenodomus lingam]
MATIYKVEKQKKENENEKEKDKEGEESRNDREARWKMQEHVLPGWPGGGPRFYEGLACCV